MSSITRNRDLKVALKRGWRLKCPACGEGSLMAGYLKIINTCVKCEENLYHHRADDGPAWATILLTGHIVAPLMLFVFTTFRPEGWVMALGFSIVFLSLTLYLLPRIKGLFVSHQWAKYLFGFESSQ
jgi:uncharacterized protein (DUF983 family)